MCCEDFVPGCGIMLLMDANEPVLPAELETLTPSERDEHFRASLILDPSTDPRMTPKLKHLVESVGQAARTRAEGW